MLWDPGWGLAPPGFLLLSHEPGQSGPLWGLGRLRFSSPFRYFHGHSNQQAAAEPNALAKSFIEALKTIPESPTGGRAIERHPCRAESGVKPRCGGTRTAFWREARGRWVLGQSMQHTLYLLQVQGGRESDWALAALRGKSENSCGPTATDQNPRAHLIYPSPQRPLGQTTRSSTAEARVLGVESRLGRSYR